MKIGIFNSWEYSQEEWSVIDYCKGELDKLFSGVTGKLELFYNSYREKLDLLENSSDITYSLFWRSLPDNFKKYFE